MLMGLVVAMYSYSYDLPYKFYHGLLFLSITRFRGFCYTYVCMATYKVPQDVEADDKFLGPLSFKQFVFGGLTLVCAYLSFLLISRNLVLLSPVFILPMIVFGFLAFPWSREQPTELWLASRIRFLIKPRRRIWDQTGMKHLVEITVPKVAAHNYTDGLSQGEVQNRVSALASMIDSRGWAVKNYNGAATDQSDRLVSGNVAEQSAVALNDNPDDVMDEYSGVIAQQFQNKIQESEAKQKSKARQLMEEARQETSSRQANPSSSNVSPTEPATNHKQEDFWFMHAPQTPTDPSLTTFGSGSVIQPGTGSDGSQAVVSNDESPLDDAALLDKIHENKRREALQTSHIRKFDPLAKDKNLGITLPEPEPTNQNQPMTTETKPDMLKYVYNNDLDVETIQRQGHKEDDSPDNEVVVSLH